MDDDTEQAAWAQYYEEWSRWLDEDEDYQLWLTQLGSEPLMQPTNSMEKGRSE